MTPTKVWREFVSDYLTDQSHWFVPKGRSVGQDNIPVFKQELEILLRDYEGRIWDKDSEELFARDMEKYGLYKPHKIDPGNFSFRAREEKQVLSLLGPAWVDDDRVIHVTSVGKALESRQVIS